jgi:hypothetical protein
MVPFLDQAQKILAQDFENHANVLSILTFVPEGVKQADYVFSARMVLVRVNNLFKEFDLVHGSFGVVRS